MRRCNVSQGRVFLAPRAHVPLRSTTLAFIRVFPNPTAVFSGSRRRAGHICRKARDTECVRGTRVRLLVASPFSSGLSPWLPNVLPPQGSRRKRGRRRPRQRSRSECHGARAAGSASTTASPEQSRWTAPCRTSSPPRSARAACNARRSALISRSKSSIARSKRARGVPRSKRPSPEGDGFPDRRL